MKRYLNLDSTYAVQLAAGDDGVTRKLRLLGKCMATVVLATLFFLPPANAENAGERAQLWTFRLAPGAWMIASDGDVAVRGRGVDFDSGDLFDEPGWAGMLNLEGKNDQWGFFANGAYANFSPNEKSDLGRGEIDSESWIVDAGLLFRLIGFREEGETLDFTLGGRYWSQRTELDGDLLGGGSDVDQTKDWIDPVAGLSYRSAFSDEWGFAIRGDIGGFNLWNSSSDLTWSAQATFDYLAVDNIDIWAGYKVLDVDFDDGSGANKFEFDTTFQGPIVGIGIGF